MSSTALLGGLHLLKEVFEVLLDVLSYDVLGNFGSELIIRTVLIRDDLLNGAR
jgi:hypothetical protein